MSTSENNPIACVLNAIPDQHREQHWWLVQQFQMAIESVTELENGFAFSLDNKPDIIVHVAEWFTWERLCCPFLHFTLEVEKETVSLSLTGDEGVKNFVKSQLPTLIGQ